VGRGYSQDITFTIPIISIYNLNVAKDRNKIIKESIKRIVQGASPDKVILFGSSSRGKIAKDSDLDLLIIKPSPHRRDQRDTEIRKLLSDIVFPMDIFVYTPEEVKKYKDLPGSFIGKIINTGKVLYESK